MGIGWIDTINNNSSTEWKLQSYDDRNNGKISAITGPEYSADLDNKNTVILRPNSRYQAEWCGIPWYFAGKHYKLLKPADGAGVQLFTSERDGGNWILCFDNKTGQEISKQAVPKGRDYRCTLNLLDSVPACGLEGITSDTGRAHHAFSLSVVNETEFSDINALRFVRSEAGEWIKTAAEIVPIFL